MIIISEAGIHAELANAQAAITSGRRGNAYRNLKNMFDAAVMEAAMQGRTQTQAAELLGISRDTIRATLERVDKEIALLQVMRQVRPTVASVKLKDQQGGAA